MHSKNLSGKIALVTGGTGGIGTGVSEALAHAGATIIVGYRSKPEEAKKLAAALPGEGHRAMRAVVDDSAAMAQLSSQVAEEFGTLDILVNNAGTTRYVEHGDLDALDDDLIDEIFRTNWRGPFACVRSFRRLLDLDNGGTVINISSIAAVTGNGSNVAYCSSKAALNCMTVSLARALAPRIRVISVSPGLLDTGFVAGLDKNWSDEQAEKTPLKGLATPADVGRAVAAICGELTFSTGCVIPVDGGRILG